MNNDDKKVIADIVDSVIVYSKDRDSSKERKKEYADVEEIDEIDDSKYIPSRKAQLSTSSDSQLVELSKSIIEGGDKNSVRKRITKILNSGDPLIESKTVMVVLARKEMENALRLMENLSFIDGKLMDKIEAGEYDDADDFILGSVGSRLEKSMGRSLTILEKVLQNPVYEEFLLAYRQEFNQEDMRNVASVATNKESRAKITNLLKALASELNKTDTGGNNEDNRVQ